MYLGGDVMAKVVKIEIPEGMYRDIEKLVEKKLFRNVADFFYVAGQKQLQTYLRILYKKPPFPILREVED
jgi:hypothetical protein